MPDDLLTYARRQAEKADPSVRAAALLRLARAESAADVGQATKTLLEGLEAVRGLPDFIQDLLLREAREVAAAVAPPLLAEIPIAAPFGHKRMLDANVVQIMLAHGHVDAAFEYLLQHDDPEFPFDSVGSVLNWLDSDRRLMLLRRAVEAWRQSLSDPGDQQRDWFVQLFGHSWKEFPSKEALEIAHMVVAEAADELDTETSAGYANEVHFTSAGQNTLFQVLHVLRHLDPALAQSLIDSHDQLAAGARRYPNGLETMHEEAAAEAERRKAEGATCGGGYIFMGDPRDFDRQRRLMNATQPGDFEPSMEDAIEKYREDTSPATRNYAPKAYWPSTGAYRSLFYQAGKTLGPEAAKLLGRIPEEDIRLFASIELASALAGLPASPISHMKQLYPPGSPPVRGRRMSGVGSSKKTMRSPDGRLIRCPKCRFRPYVDLVWNCKCKHVWNTFQTAGLCPACRFQWEVTGCPHCGEMSEHKAWYA
jgi:hypothetical protein